MSDIDLNLVYDGTVDLTLTDDGDIDLNFVNDGTITLSLDDTFSTFLLLTDTPNSYTDKSGYSLRVNSTEDGLEFISDGGSVPWGSITGTLSNQSDLQTELNLKYNSTDFNTDWDTRLAIKDTDDITEGATNLYDQTVSITGGTNVTISGAYPSFTITDNSASSTVLSSHTGDSDIHFNQSAISIPATQISDFDVEVGNNTDVSLNTTHRTSNGTDHTYIDQDITSSSSPLFSNIKVSGKVYLDYDSDSYIKYNSDSSEIEVYVGGEIRASF